MTVQIAEARPAFFEWLLLLLAAAHSFVIYLLARTLNHQEFMPGERNIGAYTFEKIRNGTIFFITFTKDFFFFWCSYM